MNLAKAHWDAKHACYVRSEIQYDDWLRQFDEVIQRCTTPIIDLGCGSGNDTKYLIERGKQVVACDYSENAIKNIRKNFPEVTDAKCFDMTEGLPFPDRFTSLLIADLSLHYFSEHTTYAILEEIRRVLKTDGFLLLRVNSVRDTNHGAGQGTEIEHHYFALPDGQYKRFFDREDIDKFFRGWELLQLTESQMTRYELPKMLWTGLFRVKK